MTAKKFAVPMVIAVTGHRDIVSTQLESIRARVHSLLNELTVSYSSNRLIILSPLAEGADLLVAEVAVELGIELLVPLPKSREDCIADFKEEQAIRRFLTLCDKATEVFVLNNSNPAAPEGMDPDLWKNAYPYANLGTFICAHCHILLAIWDGRESSRLGSTAQVVKFHHDNIMPGITPVSVSTQQMLVDDESDLVYHIVCSRNRHQEEPDLDKIEIDWFWYTKDEEKPRSKELPKQHKLIFSRSAEFSADAIEFADRIASESPTLINSAGSEALPEGIEDIDRIFRIADWLAIHYQKKALRTLLVTHVMAFFMGFMFILYSDMESTRVWLIAFLGCFGIAYLVQSLSRRGAWQRKYLDYRTLAEGLRVQFYWAAAGVTNVNKWRYSHDGYLQSQNPEFGWIRNIMRVAGIRCDANPNQNPAGVEYTIREWVGERDLGQLGYFKFKANERIKRHELTERLGKFSLAISVVTVFLFLFLSSRMTDSLHIAFTVLMGTALLLFAVREGYAYATATKELIKQYEFMLRIFDNAHRRLVDAKDANEKRLILSALGQSALDEHSDWILMHRERSLDESEIWRMGS